MLTAADRATAEFCSGIVGNREVREVDEAYSIGAAMSRDAATITPRTEVKPLILPDDIMNFPSLYGSSNSPKAFLPRASILSGAPIRSSLNPSPRRRISASPNSSLPMTMRVLVTVAGRTQPLAPC
jgi:hypothetical protein